MPCFSPLSGWYSKSRNPTGKRSIVFSPLQGLGDKPVTVRCGQCSGCRLIKSGEWAVRCMHEAQLYEHNSFITLTFSEQYLHARGRWDCPTLRLKKSEREAISYWPIEWISKYSVDVRDFQLFSKKLRQDVNYKGMDGKNGIRFYHCGEYGLCCRKCGLSGVRCRCESFYASIGRPHYHACIFNYDFPDKVLWKITPQGHRLYISEQLSRLWPFGFSTIGDLTFQSAAYTARYVMKKRNGVLADTPDEFGLRPYERMDVSTGEIHNCKPEYTTMSRREGIGKDWIKKYKNDVYPHDYVVYDGVKRKPPRFYDEYLEAIDVETYTDLKNKRLIKAREYEIDNTSERLEVRERVQDVRNSKLLRKL